MKALDAPDGEKTDAQDKRFVRSRSDKDAHVRFSLLRAFACAWAGIAYTARTQRNMMIHLFVSVAVVALGIVLSIDAISWALVALCIALVLAAECLNTAVESVVDLVSPGYADLARRAKDCAAGAVLVCAVGAVTVGMIVFVPRIVSMFP